MDQIAECIRALGAPAPASYHHFAALAKIPDDDGQPNATEMLRRLVQGQETIVRTARSVLPVVERAQDQASIDLLTQRMEVHEKNAWMLRRMLGP